MSEDAPTPGTVRSEGRFVALRIVVSVTVGLIWAGFVLGLVELGSCDAYGGRCDGTRPPIFEDDVAGGAFMGTAAAAWLLWWLRQPSRRQAAVGVFVAFAAGVVVAVVARDMAHG